jgi:hypothetical protein
MRVRRRGGRVEVTLDRAEAAALRAMAGQVDALLGDPQPVAADPLEAALGLPAEPIAAPDDPAVARLLPAAYADDREAAEFRRLTDGELRAAKRAALGAVTAALGGGPGGEPGGGGKVRVSLDEEQADVWLRAVNDVRLVLGVRLDVTEDLAERYADLTPDDPRVPLLLAYEWLGALQQLVLDALDG